MSGQALTPEMNPERVSPQRVIRLASARPPGVEAAHAVPSEPPWLPWLCRQIAANRFIPVPPPDRRFVGDGDFRAIGAEFLGHFVRLGGLRPGEAVLDIGCGIGRMALPLTQYLAPDHGCYEGIDVVANAIAWCSATITPVYPNFRFHHLDLANALYNPGGRLPAAAVALPFAAASFDFVILTSVLTHLLPEETAAYAVEIGRVLRPGGRCFLSLFLIEDTARQGLRQDGGRLRFDPDGSSGPSFHVAGTPPASAVAYDEAWLTALFAGAGLMRRSPVTRGRWCGRAAGPYQDLCLFEKTG